MPVSQYSRTADVSFGPGYRTFAFNPPNDAAGAEVNSVRYRMLLDYNNGARVDLGDITVYLRSPDGERQTIYFNLDTTIGADNDDNEDSDPENDFDIEFSGTDDVSTETGFRGNPVNGTWYLEVDNETNRTLTLDYLDVWVDWDEPPSADVTVRDLRFSGNPTYDEIMTISADIQNIGDRGIGNFRADLYINGEFEESSTLTLGLLAGQSWTERFSFRVDTIGLTEAEVRLVNTNGDSNPDNNSRTESFTPRTGDLTITDLKFSGNPSLGELMTIEADIENIGDGNYIEFTTLELYVNGATEPDATSVLTFGLLAGQRWTERFTYRVEQPGQNTVEVRIVNTEGEPVGNNSRTESFVPAQHDLLMSDIRISAPPSPGETITIFGDVTNIGDDGTLDAFEIVFFIGGEEIGREQAPFGLLEGLTLTRDIDYTVPADQSGPLAITARIEGIAQDARYGNNSRTETFGGNLSELGTEIELAAHLNRTVYGDQALPVGYRGEDDDDNGLDDDYSGYLDTLGWQVLTYTELGMTEGLDNITTRFTDGGLFEGRQTIIDPWEAQALVTLGIDETGARTVVLSFRGTDNNLEALDGQAFSGDGQYNYYGGLRPLIQATTDFVNDDSNGIDKFIVTGHSLGGAMVDLFTAVDGQHVDGDVELHAISLASAGLNPDVLTDGPAASGFDGEYDTSIVRETLFSVDLTAPDWYTGLSHSQDSVTFPLENAIGINLLLVTNVNFNDGLWVLDLPTIENGDKSGFGFGAEHDFGLYWANLSGLANDPLLPFHDGEALSFGETRYQSVPDLDGTPLAVFSAFDDLGVAGYDNDRFLLDGGVQGDYILGLSGDDRIFGNGGADLLSGGQGNDEMRGGGGDDRLHGGVGFDTIQGDAGNDTVTGFGGFDSLSGNAGDDELSGNGGNDTLMGGAGNDTLNGGYGADDLQGGLGGDLVVGLEGFDLLSGGADNDTLNGNFGNDTLRGDSGADRLDGGLGSDSLIGGDGDDSLRAANGFDTLDGGAGNDLVEGNAGNDRLNGGPGDDTLRGGIGADTFLFESGSGADTIVDFQNNIDSVVLQRSLFAETDPAPGDIRGYAGRNTDGDVVLDFGNGDVLTFNRVATTAALIDDIVLV